MREIKFRAWDTDRQELSLPFELGGYPTFKNGRTKPYWTHTCMIQQYTGLKDKNGKEIYEGDIIKAYRRDDHSKVDPKTSEVTFLNGCYMAFNCTYHELYRLWQSELEIIGNIYENPELLSA